MIWQRASRLLVKDVMNYTKKSYELFKNMRGGKPTPMMMSELNSDGDVTGPYDQVNQVKEFLDMIKKEKMTWFSGFSFYQFRDRGRLGLEIEDPNNPNVGIKQPIMDYFKKMVHISHQRSESQVQKKFSSLFSSVGAIQRMQMDLQ